MVLFVLENGENPEVKAQNSIGFLGAVPHYGSVSGSNVGQGVRVLRQRKGIKNCGAETKNSRGKIYPAETIRKENLREQTNHKEDRQCQPLCAIV